jgi:ATP-dependent exoDNAse (exonuclease V) beta subunit
MITNFSHIKFNADEHSYTLGDKKLRPVTHYLKGFQKPFDRDGIAQRTATKQSHSVAQVLAEWDATGERARTLGLAVHSYIEQTLHGNGTGQLTLDPFLSLNTKLPEILAFDNFWQQLAPKVCYSKENIEWVIGDADLGLAGTVDAVLFNSKTGKHHIWDWKTGRFDLENKFENLLEPFDYLSASKFNIYSLQVSLYRLIIERNTDLEFGDSYIVHLSSDGTAVYRAIDLRERLLDWMEVPF